MTCIPAALNRLTVFEYCCHISRWCNGSALWSQCVLVPQSTAERERERRETVVSANIIGSQHPPLPLTSYNVLRHLCDLDYLIQPFLHSALRGLCCSCLPCTERQHQPQCAAGSDELWQTVWRQKYSSDVQDEGDTGEKGGRGLIGRHSWYGVVTWTRYRLSARDWERKTSTYNMRCIKIDELRWINISRLPR